MLLSDYRTLVQNEVDDTSAAAQNVIDQALKDAYQEILAQTRMYLIGSSTQDQTAVVNTQAYTTSTEFSDIVGAFWKTPGGSTWSQLAPITEEEYLSSRINDANSTPTAYYIKGLYLYLSPTPSEAGTLRIVYIPIQSELSGATVSVIPDRFTKVLVYGAAYRFFGYEKGSEAIEYKRWYEEALNAMLNELAMRSSSTIFKPTLYGN